MIRSGFTIVFGGPSFQPKEFLRDSSLDPSIFHRGDVLSSGSVAEESWLEFGDVHDGTYPLDIGAEAMDFLRAHRDGFIRLSRFPGVVRRSLNIFGDADSCSVELEPDDIALLHELSMHLSICAYRDGAEPA